LGIGSFVFGTEPSTPLPSVPFLGVTFPVVKGKNEGVLIRSVIKESIAESSGIKAGDVMIRFAGKELNGNHTLTRLIRENGWNRTVEIVLLRDDQKVVVEATFPQEPSKEDG
jgi:serine protease Do